MLQRWVCVAALLAATSCTVKVNPDVGRFSCDANGDCGAKFECRPQASGGRGLCYPIGQCTDVELCNGLDDNCDGRVDESFPEQAVVCATGVPGLCAAGLNVCDNGALNCVQTVQPRAELCNLLDDDCDGVVDEDFDLATNNAHCGACNLACDVDAGTGCRGASCEEVACSDGLDNDGDGKVDCADPGCAGESCNAAQPNRNCALPPDAGADAGTLDAGVGACLLRENDCKNGIDDDGDGRTDCEDPDCDGRTCASGIDCANRICPKPG